MTIDAWIELLTLPYNKDEIDPCLQNDLYTPYGYVDCSRW